jgi:hypothetical protein
LNWRKLWPWGNSSIPKDRPWEILDAKLSTFLTGLDETDLEIVRLRWVRKGQRHDRQWRNHRTAHYWFRVPIIVGAATVPVLAGLGVPNLATALVGLAVAILTGLDSFFRYGLRWQQARQSALAFEDEGWLFVELAGPYAEQPDHRAALKPFLTNLEAMNRRLGMAYLDLFRDTEPERKPVGPGEPASTPQPGSTSEAGAVPPSDIAVAEVVASDASQVPPDDDDPHDTDR